MEKGKRGESSATSAITKSLIRIACQGFPMDKGKRIESVDGEFQLPETIIQHIQSFLTGREAAQTSILSKSWYSAWSTRPNLDFNQRDFRRNRNPFNRIQMSQIIGEFSEFATKTMQRYEDLNLKIESFRLLMENTWMSIPGHDSHSLANKLIVKAMKMGATDLNFELQPKYTKFIFPHEVLESQTLISLSVNGCKIDRGVDGKVRCSRLKSLSFCEVVLEGDMMWNIISSCPLIERLLLSSCKCAIKVPDSNVATRIVTTMLPLRLVEIGKQNVGSVVDGSINLYELHKLKCLVLENMDIDTLFFCNFSSKFPCLTDLTVRYCTGYKGIRISSRSLVCINFAEKTMLRVKFDVPSIQKFTFSGPCFPSLSFKTASREWESDISISCYRRPSTLWFLKLNKLLTKLSLSKISLSLNVWSQKSFDYTGDIQGLPRPVVENLNLKIQAPSSVCSSLFDGLFQCCRPKFITQQCWFPRERNTDFLEVLCKRLMQQVSQNCCIANQTMFGECDLKEVNVEVFEENVVEWRPLPLKTLLDASTTPETEQKTRFVLRWGMEPIALR